ncbi:MAG: hypothetical protein H0U10_05725 [Chloroflexia bacterium]|nr:hypothetical protein [Chloroflexia bacterium]
MTTTTTTNVFAVVGQATADPGRLLLLGEDGRFYAYAADGRLRPADPEIGWRLDGGEPPEHPDGREETGVGPPAQLRS